MAYGENLKFMYLLERHKALDHNTLAWFHSQILGSEAGEDLLGQMVEQLIRPGVVDMVTAFINGTKIEMNANKYAFARKKDSK